MTFRLCTKCHCMTQVWSHGPTMCNECWPTGDLVYFQHGRYDGYYYSNRLLDDLGRQCQAGTVDDIREALKERGFWMEGMTKIFTRDEWEARNARPE